MLDTVLFDALPAEYEVEARNLASCDSIGRKESIKDVKGRPRRRFRNGNKESNAAYVGHAVYARNSHGSGRGKGGDSG